MNERISLSEAGRRLRVPKQTLSEWRTLPGFPPVERRGRALTVDLDELRAWVRTRRRAQRKADAAVAENREFKRLHGMLWRRARWLFSPLDLSLVLSDCATVDDLHHKARELGVGPLR